MPKSKYYKILGLPNNATITEVRKAYRKLVMQYHPDRNDSAKAQDKFILIKEAYEILLGKKAAPKSLTPRTRTAQNATNEAQEQIIKEERAREGQLRYKQQKQKEYAENEHYYQKLTQGAKWKTIRFSALIGLILSVLMISDYILPHHYEENKVAAYNLNYAHGLDGHVISLIKTESDDFYWVENASFDLFGRNRVMLVESSWFFHNPIQVISKGKINNTAYDVNFNVYTISWLLLLLFLTPSFTLLYKRKKISFTVLHFFSYYGVNAVILVYLISGNRWAHLITLGFL